CSETDGFGSEVLCLYIPTDDHKANSAGTSRRAAECADVQIPVETKIRTAKRCGSGSLFTRSKAALRAEWVYSQEEPSPRSGSFGGKEWREMGAFRNSFPLRR